MALAERKYAADSQIEFDLIFLSANLRLYFFSLNSFVALYLPKIKTNETSNKTRNDYGTADRARSES